MYLPCYLSTDYSGPQFYSATKLISANAATCTAIYEDINKKKILLKCDSIKFPRAINTRNLAMEKITL